MNDKLFVIVYLAYSFTMHDLYCVVFIRFVHHHKVEGQSVDLTRLLKH